MRSTILYCLLASASFTCGLYTKRAAPSGAGCGPSAGNAVCGAGLCCSETGVCGTGTAFCGAPGCQLSFGPACDGNQTPPGKDTSGVARPLFGNVPYGVDVSHCTVPGKVAITFDDGPYIYTTDLLDILKRNNVVATFFVVGANGGKGQIQDSATGYPAIIQRMYAEGHQIGSHTWSHQDLSALTAQQRRDQIVKNEIALVDILGFFPTYFRPPYTRWNADALTDLKALGYHVLNYDIDTRDWQGDYTYAQNTYSSILAQRGPGSSSWVALSHDILDKTVHGFAQYMIDQAKQQGYQLVTVGECLGDPPANWYRDPSSGQPFVAAKQGVAQAETSTPVASSPVPKTSIIATSTSSSTRSSAMTSSHSVSSSISVSTSFSTSSSTFSSTSQVTPTPVASPNFGAGTGNSTGMVSGSGPTATLAPAAAKLPSAAGHVTHNYTLGLMLGLSAFVFLL